MSHVNVTINDRQYRMACEEGQEARLLRLAESLESRIQSLRGKFGEIGDARLTVMAAITVCDELLDAGQRIRALVDLVVQDFEPHVGDADIVNIREDQGDMGGNGFPVFHYLVELTAHVSTGFLDAQ